jgi:hypothetical protein
LGNIFQGFKSKYVPAAVRRSVFLHENIEKGELEKFCVWLINNYSPRCLEWAFVKKHITPAQRQNLEDFDRFKELCNSLSPRNYPDAFHLWSAEIGGMQYFLTTDKNFRSALSQKKLSRSCKIVSPTDLLGLLKVKERDPMPFKYGCKYMLGGRLIEELSGRQDAQRFS